MLLFVNHKYQILVKYILYIYKRIIISEHSSCTASLVDKSELLLHQGHCEENDDGYNTDKTQQLLVGTSNGLTLLTTVIVQIINKPKCLTNKC